MYRGGRVPKHIKLPNKITATMLPLPPRRYQAATSVALPSCPHRPCLHRGAAAKLPPTLRCRATLLPLPHPLCCCHRTTAVALCAVAALPLLPRRCQAATDVPLSCCRHRRCHCHCAPVCWLIVALSSNFVIACCYGTVDAIVAGHFANNCLKLVF